MILVEIKLKSANGPHRDQDLGTLILDNVTSVDDLLASNGNVSDYRARMYRKGDLKRLGEWGLSSKGKPTRTAVVKGHRRNAEPVQNLVAKALTALGYK